MTIRSYMRGYREGRYSHPLHLVWKLVWIVPVYACAAVTAMVICIGWGYRRAEQFVSENV